MAFTQVTAAGISTGNSLTIQELNTVGVITAATVQVGSATTIHTTGIDLGGGNITSHNINSTGIITATGAVITGNLEVQGTTTTLDSLVTEVDKLEVAANNTNVAVAVTQSGTGDILNLFDGSTEVFTVTDGGNVGIGVTNPESKLDINGGTVSSIPSGTIRNILTISERGTQSSTGQTILFKNKEQSWEQGGITALREGSTNNFSLLLSSSSGGSNTERLRIASTGLVGIGTDAPDGRLHIYSGPTNPTRVIIQGDGSSTAAASLILHSSDESANWRATGTFYYDVQGDVEWFSGRPYGASDAFAIHRKATVGGSTGNSTANSTNSLFLLNSSGNLGINTTTPRAKLDVMSTGNFTVDGDTFDGVSLMIRNDGGTQGNGNYGSAIAFTQIGNPGVAGYRAAITSVQTGSDSDQLGLAFLTHPSVTGGDDLSEALRITSSGNVGIGTNSPTRKLDVEIQTASGAVGSVLSSHPIAEFINISAGASRGLEIGAPPDGFLSPVYLKVSGTGSRFAILDQSNHENFTILDSGNIGIGTNNPGAILEVAAAANAQRHLRVITHNSGDSCLQSVYPPNGTLRSIALEGSTVDFYTDSGSDTTGIFRGRFDSNGNLGINTNAPGAKLDVRGSAFLSPLSLTSGGDGSWIKSAYGAISNSVVSSLNNLLIGQNMRGYLNSDGGSTNNNYYHTSTYSSGTMGYAGLEFGYGGIAKFFTGTPATTANATFTPTERLRINAAGNISMGKADDAVGWGAGVPTFEITGNSGSYPTRGGFIGLESQSKVNGYGGMWLDNDTLSFYLGQARNSLQTPVERLRITYNSSPSVGIATNGVFHVTQNLPLTIQGQGFGHGWTQGGTAQDAIYLTAGASGTFTALTLSVDKGSWGSLCYEIHAHAYSGRYVHRLGGWYQNGGSFNQYGTTTFGDSNASFAYNAPGSQQFTITLSGGNWTHPIAWLRLAHSGAGSLNYNNISFKWS